MDGHGRRDLGGSQQPPEPRRPLRISRRSIVAIHAGRRGVGGGLISGLLRLRGSKFFSIEFAMRKLCNFVPPKLRPRPRDWRRCRLGLVSSGFGWAWLVMA